MSRARRELSRVFAVIVLLAAVVGCGGGGVAVLSPATVQNTRTVDQTEQVILDTLPRRGWTAETVQPGRILAFLAVRKHLLRTEIRYDARQVNVYYVDSDNLAAHVEADGRVYGHPKINSWIAILARDISLALMAQQAPTSGGMPPPPPPPPPGP